MIDVTVSGTKEIADKLKRLPAFMRGVVTEAAAEYILKALRTTEIPKYKYVSRKRAYPEVGGWFSDKQRKWFFWALRTGQISTPYKRSGELVKAWRIEGQGIYARVVNSSPVSQHAYDNDKQARQLGLVGWRKIGDILSTTGAEGTSFWRGANRAINKAIDKALKTLRLKS